MRIFNKDFYPTPKEVITQMLIGQNVEGISFLEPSAGKGNIVDELNRRGAEQVLTFEKEPELASIISEKSTLLGNDFLQCSTHQISHIDCIIMNPPFSAEEKHILHAWNVAPEGCHIISLCPTSTVNDSVGTSYRRRLGNIIKNYGDASIELGDCFSNAERKTNVEVSIVHLFKPVLSEDFDYEGFYLDPEPEHDYPEGIMPYNEIQSIVSRYVSALKCFDEFREIADRMNGIVKPLGLTEGFRFKFSYNEGVTTKKAFAKQLQKKAWKHVFDKMNMDKFVTSGVMSDINKFVETQSKYPFTVKNIYRMLKIVIGTRGQTMEKALEEAFDKITMHYDENRYQVEGWKTNSHYLINQKFILPYMVEQGFSGQMQFRYSRNTDKITDLNKALCYITGRDNKLGTLKYSMEQMYDNDLDFHQWYDWGFFEIKGFKKGTLHCKFKDEKVWELFNRRVAEIKEYPLPEAVQI